jgi:hypothetical protein
MSTAKYNKSLPKPSLLNLIGRWVYLPETYYFLMSNKTQSIKGLLRTVKINLYKNWQQLANTNHVHEALA